MGQPTQNHESIQLKKNGKQKKIIEAKGPIVPK
jgi:hypothetical protein